MGLINTNKYIKILKDNKILSAIEKERYIFSGIGDEDITEDNVLIGIILYLYIISGTNRDLSREASTKIKHIKLLRDCTGWRDRTLHLRAAKIFVETLMDLDFIVDGKNSAQYIETDIKDIGICLRDELADCYNGNIETLIAKFMLLGDISDTIKAYLFSRK
ncbi:MAG: hypothetical protein ACOCQD_04290 [archaeon]